MAYISVKNLKYRYPKTKNLALDGINLEIEKGEFIGIIGKNGSGKSTLCQAFIGLVPHFFRGAYGGSVKIGDDMDVLHSTVPEICQKVGLVFQNPFNQLSGAKDTVFEEVAFGLQNFGISKEEIKNRVQEALKLLDMEAYCDRNPFDLSGGQMQRVALASVLAMKPEVLILDEPTSQLDPAGTEEVFQAVDTLAKSGITIIMVEQKIEKLAKYCDKLLLLNEGKQIAFDRPEIVFSRPDLEGYGVFAPIYTRVCQIFDVKMENGYFPAKLEDAVALKQKFPAEDSICGKKKTVMDADISNTFDIQNLDFYYTEGTPIIEGLNLCLDTRNTAILGQNGAGKTTLVKLLKGLLKPVHGNIYYGQEDLTQYTVAMLAGKVGYVFQNPDDQIFKYRVLDEVMFGPLNIGMDRRKAKKKAMEALEIVGLAHLAKENPYDLELCERKLVAIASVLAMETDVLILDEPTIAQDVEGKKIIGRIIKDLSKQGKTVIAILHDMEFVAQYFERIIVMAKGKVLADGSKEKVFAKTDILEKACIEQPYLTQFCQKLGYQKLYFDLEDLV